MELRPYLTFPQLAPGNHSSKLRGGPSRSTLEICTEIPLSRIVEQEPHAVRHDSRTRFDMTALPIRKLPKNWNGAFEATRDPASEK